MVKRNFFKEIIFFYFQVQTQLIIEEKKMGIKKNVALLKCAFC